jgi:ribosomal RNA-processing protein 36
MERFPEAEIERLKKGVPVQRLVEASGIELKKGGKLDRYMEKRRRRNAAKDHRYVPSARRGEE